MDKALLNKFELQKKLLILIGYITLQHLIENKILLLHISNDQSIIYFHNSSKLLSTL